MRCLAALFSLSVALGPGMVRADVYDCELVVPMAENWVPQTVHLIHDQKTGTVTVTDPVSAHHIGKPIEGAVKTDNAKRITFGWRLKMVKSVSRQKVSQMIYSMTYFRKDGTVQIKAVPAGYTNHFIAQGRCTVK